MTRQIRTTNVTGRLIILGTGTSVGVPTIGCGCEVCTSVDSKNQRTRCSIVLGLPQGNLLVDTPPDLRFQLLREGIGVVHSVLYTHEHSDHLLGLDDLRIMQFYLKAPVPIYCEEKVERRIRQVFDYAFHDESPTHPGAAPKLKFHPIDHEPFSALGQPIIPIPLRHGPRFDVLGFRFGDLAYCTDTNEIPPDSWPLLQGLDVLILDALRKRPHPTHLSLDEAIDIAHRVGARRTLFTHISHELDHESTCASLPPGMELAYDGQTLPFLGGPDGAQLVDR